MQNLIKTEGAQKKMFPNFKNFRQVLGQSGGEGRNIPPPPRQGMYLLKKYMGNMMCEKSIVVSITKINHHLTRVKVAAMIKSREETKKIFRGQWLRNDTYKKKGSHLDENIAKVPISNFVFTKEWFLKNQQQQMGSSR